MSVNLKIIVHGVCKNCGQEFTYTTRDAMGYSKRKEFCSSNCRQVFNDRHRIRRGKKSG